MIFRVAGLALIALAALSIPAAARAAPLELKRVMLSSGGVGYFEYEATVSGDDTLTLDARLDQVDDILKSLVVYDDGGSVVSVALASREPLAQLLRDLPFDGRALDTPQALLNALQGAELKVGNPRPMTGRILKAEDETSTNRDGVTTKRTRVSLMTASGLQQFVLEEADMVGFVDPTLQAKLADALGSIARYHDGGRRTLTLQTHGGQNRIVRVGYVVGAPLWKASYRLTFAADQAADKARLQGWAVLENTTGQDWTGVELTLLSGNPITFRQKLYESYYVDRPEVPVEVVGRVLPKPDEGAVALAQTDAVPAPKLERQHAAPAPASGAQATTIRGTAGGSTPQYFAGLTSPAESTETDTQVVFRLPEPVSVGAGRSAIIPMLDRELPAARLTMLQSGGTSPLASFQIKNDSASGLPPGVLTLYERAGDGTTAYVGDARLATFPVGEQRLLSYAVDGKVKIDRTVNSANPIASAAIANGVLRLTRKLQTTTLYRLAGPAHEPRRLVLEHPRQVGWTLVEPDPASVEVTAGAYRIAAALKPGETKTITVTMELPQQEVIKMLDADDARLDALFSARELDPKLHDALGELMNRRRALAGQRDQLQRLQGEREAIVQDQARLRDNLNAVPKGTPLYNRLIDELGQTETRLEALAAAIAKANGAIEQTSAALAEYVGKLTL